MLLFCYGCKKMIFPKAMLDDLTCPLYFSKIEHIELAMRRKRKYQISSNIYGLFWFGR